MDWLAGTLELIGLWKVGAKNRRGFLFNLACCLCWITFVIITGQAKGLLVVVVPAALINIRNFILWRPGRCYVYRALTLAESVLK